MPSEGEIEGLANLALVTPFSRVWRITSQPYPIEYRPFSSLPIALRLY